MAAKVFEALFYGLGAFGVGAASRVIYLVLKAFSRKQNQILEKSFAEKQTQFLLRKQRVDRALRRK